MSSRKIAGFLCLAGLLAFVLLAMIWVPWQLLAGEPPEPADAHSVFTDAEIALAQDYSTHARWLSLTSYAVAIGLVALIGFTRLGERVTRRLPGPWWTQLISAVLGVLLLRRLVTLPFALALREHRLEFGLTSQTLAGFFRDLSTEWALSGVVSLAIVVTIVGCARRLPRAWPAVAGLLLMALTMAASFVYPVVIEPLFNDFRSLPASPLREDVMELADAEGVPLDDILVADASRRTTSLNAYVSGFGSTRRVVLYDNLVSGVPAEQTLAVVAHELAHARHNDVLWGSSLGAAGVLIAVGLLGLVVPGKGHLVGQLQPGDPAIALRLVALVAVAGLLAAPIQNMISRDIETRADLDALAATQDGDTVEALQRELALRSLADPTPPALVQWWWGSHPTVLERIGIARDFRDSAGDGQG